MSNSSKKAAKFNPAAIIKKTSAIQQIIDPDLGLIRYRMLSVKAELELQKKQPSVERDLEILAYMLAPTNPGLTVETLKLMPADVVIRLCSLLKVMNAFLPLKPATPNVDLPKGEVKPE